MAMSLRQDLLYLLDRKFHHPQKLLRLLQRERPLGLMMLVQMLKKMGQNVRESLLLGENHPHHGEDLQCHEELDLLDEWILLAVVLILLSVLIVAEGGTHLLGGDPCLQEEVVPHLHLGALDPLQGSHLEECVEAQVEDGLLLHP